MLEILDLIVCGHRWLNAEWIASTKNIIRIANWGIYTAFGTLMRKILVGCIIADLNILRNEYVIGAIHIGLCMIDSFDSLLDAFDW